MRGQTNLLFDSLETDRCTINWKKLQSHMDLFLIFPWKLKYINEC